ncbi:MAG TPA: hypothetical protein VKU00_06590 [Chthonomonadaceae bacterium]|nr:hypothetical protein [Chthonomonadaceae bacterium]
MKRISWLFFPLAYCLLLVVSGYASAQSGPSNLISGMVWRNIGPFRGGRVSAVTGAIGQPGVYYMGLPMGGIWKTTSAGTTWFPVFDSIKEVSSVGSIEATPSDPNVLYAGMGDMLAGGGISRGNGVYKSTDAGKTWRHMGLDKTEHIPSILVDPHNPNLVMVAAEGPTTVKSDARGLYRSTDGGVTWTKTLNIDDTTGVQKITWAFDHPEVMLATTMRNYSPPGQIRGFGGGQDQGPSGTRLFKSTDEGLTWKEITGKGLPALAGRTCVAIAMNTGARRMFLVGNFGLYRSDDGGDTWKQMDAADRRVGNGQGGYNCGVYVNSQNPDIVYVINTCSYRSLDGGTTFTGFKGAPGGDDPQQMWIDPTNGSRLFLGTDQGATVSLDGGQNWSSWYNQSTAQVYHISVDNQFPYWVYATQQDSGSVATISRGNFGEITSLDWLPHPGYEFGSIVADPLNPKVSYAGGPGGGIIRTTYPSGQWINVSPSMDSKLSLRKVSNQPLLFSPKNPHELFTAFQYVMSTTDGGKHWRKLSPDLSLKPGEKAPASPGSPAAVAAGNQPEEEEDVDAEEEEQQGRPGGAIESISVSNVDGNVIWAGTSNGLIKLTRDHGTTWDDVSIPDLPNANRADISAIDASHQDAGVAYVAVDCHGMGDYKPYLYRTRDYGKTWTQIVTGLPDNMVGGSFARVIRADTVRQGLLFAGTESSVYFSTDDGDHWQSLTLNLPNTSCRDMVVKDNDLVVGTYGRGFWILDDISPLRQMAQASASKPAYLFKPAVATRVRRNVNGDTPFPPEVPHAENPPLGAILYYYLASPPQGEITLEVRDSRGKVVSHMSSAAPHALAEPPPPIPDFWVEKPAPLPATPGLNRTSWNLRYDCPAVFNHSYEINANPGQTPASPEGPLVLPGEYTITLTVDGKSYRQTLTVRNDPRSPASYNDLLAQHALQMSLCQCTQEAWDCFHQVADTRSALDAILKAHPPDEVASAARALDGKLLLVNGSLAGGRRFGGGGGPPGAGGAPRQPTFMAVNGTAARQLTTLDSGDMAPGEAIRKACMATCADMQGAMKSWETLRRTDLPAFNALLAKNNLKPAGNLQTMALPEIKQPAAHEAKAGSK